MTLAEMFDRLSGNPAISLVDREGLAEFARAHPKCLAGFFSDPKSHPENADLAVVLPELLRAFPSLRAAVLKPEAVVSVARDYGVAVYPALVFLTDGQAFKVMARIQAWADYHSQIQQWLDREG
jgi:hydrogenase-1 operon protein HyaE